MFNEDADWSDEEEPQIVVKSVSKGSKKTDSSTKVKVVGKKSLLRTLQTLGSVPAWKDEDLKQDDDSDAEAAPSPTKTTEKKTTKKRTYRRKRAGASEGKEKEDVEESVKEEKPVRKKRKKDGKVGVPKVESESEGATKIDKTADNVEQNAKNPQSTDKLSRKQWKAKMKNKKKCKNKFRQDQPVKEVNNKPPDELKKEIKVMDSDRNESEKPSQTSAGKAKQGKLQKRGKSGGEITEKQINNNNSSGDGGSSAESKVEIITEDQPQISPKQKKLSREENQRREKLRRLFLQKQKEPVVEPDTGKEEKKEEEEEKKEEEEEEKPSHAASFRSRMEQRLDAARFRYINEVLYSSTSGEAKRMFSQDPQAFWVYHRGYTAQVQRWPQNPVDDIIAYIRKQSPSLVVADFGCGDCKIARSVKNKVHSFDLAATCELATVCDMAHVPLKDGSVHIAVFCLSLMGTNLADFLAEANRVLKKGGILKIAEVASRFDNVRSFLTALARLGFKMTLKNTENTHFYTFEFVKTDDAPENVKKFGLQLKPCVYKKR